MILGPEINQGRLDRENRTMEKRITEEAHEEELDALKAIWLVCAKRSPDPLPPS
jgi:hypothetical protein